MRHAFAPIGLALALMFFTQAAQAESCGEKIARLQQIIANRPAAQDPPGATLPESTDAKLHHQPTVASVDKAIRQSDADTLDQARLLDAEGKEKACLEALKPLERR